MNSMTVELLILLGTIVGLFIWNRSESRADIRESRENIRESREESRADSRRIMDLIEAIKNEMKDFHGRLCATEEKRKNEGK